MCGDGSIKMRLLGVANLKKQKLILYIEGCSFLDEGGGYWKR